MSYCRWSSDCYQSDVYVYEDTSGGWTTHVAGSRHHPLKPCPTPPAKHTVEATMAYWMECDEWLAGVSNWEFQNIDHEAAGRTFNDPTAKDCAERLRRMQSEGLIVPQYAIDALEVEVAE